jgi:hypothetical protein
MAKAHLRAGQLRFRTSTSVPKSTECKVGTANSGAVFRPPLKSAGHALRRINSKPRTGKGAGSMESEIRPKWALDLAERIEAQIASVEKKESRE